MSYMKAADVLPKELLDKIQDYVDGEYLYIPRKENSRKSWGENTDAKKEIYLRNMEIYEKYMAEMPVSRLSEIYYLSPKSIQKIIADIKRKSQ